MNYIYEPKGRAAEYAPLALNIFSGCPHACEYCYVRRRFGRCATAPKPRLNLYSLDAEAARFAGDKRPIMLSFFCDPIPRGMGPELRKYVEQCLRILLSAGLSVRILSKSGVTAQDLFPLLAEHADRVEFGQSLTYMLADDWRRFESGASSPVSRITALQRAKDAGLRTFVSCEPLVDPHNLMQNIRCRAVATAVDRWNVGGPPNYWTEPGETTPLRWQELADVVNACCNVGRVVGLKRDAWKLLSAHESGLRAADRCEWLWMPEDERTPADRRRRRDVVTTL